VLNEVRYEVSTLEVSTPHSTLVQCVQRVACSVQYLFRGEYIPHIVYPQYYPY
jgi:hypothetical protein